MPAITDIEGLMVVDEEGEQKAVVRHVLFHPEEPRVVALEVVPAGDRIKLDRRARYLPFSPALFAVAGDRDVILWDGKLPRRSSVEKHLGFSLDTSVIWHNMEVRLETGGRVGFVADAVFSRKTGKVTRVVLSEGSLADIAVGHRDIPGELVLGFDGSGVIIDPSFRAIAASGGLAAASGRSAAYVKVGADRAADAVTNAGVAGLGALEKSFRSGLGREAIRNIKKAGRAARKAIEGDEE